MRRNFVVILLIAFVAIVAGCTSNPNMEPDQDLSNMDDPETGNNKENETTDDSTSSEDTSDTSGTTNESDVREIIVEGGNYYFDNDTISVEKGETVRIVLENVGGFHDLRIPSKEIGTDRIEGGQSDSFTVTFDETGSYEFLCSVGSHAAQGMTGTIEVS